MQYSILDKKILYVQSFVNLDSASFIRGTDQQKFQTSVPIVIFGRRVQRVFGNCGEDLLSRCGQQEWSRTWSVSWEDRDETSEHGADHEDIDQVMNHH